MRAFRILNCCCFGYASGASGGVETPTRSSSSSDSSLAIGAVFSSSAGGGSDTVVGASGGGGGFSRNCVSVHPDVSDEARSMSNALLNDANLQDLPQKLRDLGDRKT